MQRRVLAGFDPQWPILNVGVADFEFSLQCSKERYLMARPAFQDRRPVSSIVER
jgi:hypothetical protein